MKTEHETDKAQGEWTADTVHDLLWHRYEQCYTLQDVANAHNAALAAERELRDEARAQREHLIKECARIGVTVNVAIGAPITEAYRLVNTESNQLREQLAAHQLALRTIRDNPAHSYEAPKVASDALNGDTNALDAAIAEAVDAAHQEILILKQNRERDTAAARQPLVDGLHRLYALRDPTCQAQAERAYEMALGQVKDEKYPLPDGRTK